MTRVLSIMALLTLAYSVDARAHEHKVLGTVNSAAAGHVTMTTTDGRTVTVTITAHTKVLKGKEAVKVTALRAGTRIVVTTESDTAPYAAKLIQVGVTKPLKQNE